MLYVTQSRVPVSMFTGIRVVPRVDSDLVPLWDGVFSYIRKDISSLVSELLMRMLSAIRSRRHFRSYWMHDMGYCEQ